MNVAVWEEPDLHLVKDTLSVGTFIRLRNVHETRLLTGLRCTFDCMCNSMFLMLAGTQLTAILVLLQAWAFRQSPT